MGGRTDENNIVGVIGPAKVQGGGGYRMSGPNRRPLSNINRNNVVGVSPYHPCAVNKKGFNEKHVICGSKNPSIPPNRPVTRKFAAQLANTTAQVLQPKRSYPTAIVDVEEYMSGDSSVVPMYVKHTEAMMDEIDLMEEVEMEDAVPESVVDIDCGDSSNPLAVVEYIDDIYSHYKQTENSGCVFPNYMAHQYDINEKMRAILVDWLIEVHYKFELMDETLFLTVNLIDRFLERQAISRKKLQLVGVTALLLACKYEEVSVPVVDDLIVISDRAYSREEIINMEKLILNKLQFNMSVPTPYVFMRRFLKAAQSEKKVELLSFYMIELSLVEYEMLKYPPSLLAAAAVYTAQCIANKSRQWSKTCIWYTTYTEDGLLECARRMAMFHHKAGTGKLNGVYKKYITHKFGCAAKSEPAHFLLEN